MTARSPLFEFMPYGAPELLAAQRPNLLRALALASGLALVAFAIAQLLGINLATAPRAVDVSIHLVDLPPPPALPRIEEPRLPAVAPARGIQPGVIQPVVDPPPSEPPVMTNSNSQVGTGPGTSETTVATKVNDHPVTLVEDPLPKVNDYVYVDEMPAAVRIVDPVYPEIAKSADVEGRVYVHILVGKDGRVMNVEVDPKFSVLMLDGAAVDAARQWVFKPAFVNQHPVPVWVGQMFVFTLHK